MLHCCVCIVDISAMPNVRPRSELRRVVTRDHSRPALASWFAVERPQPYIPAPKWAAAYLYADYAVCMDSAQVHQLQQSSCAAFGEGHIRVQRGRAPVLGAQFGYARQKRGFTTSMQLYLLTLQQVTTWLAQRWCGRPSSLVSTDIPICCMHTLDRIHQAHF